MAATGKFFWQTITVFIVFLAVLAVCVEAKGKSKADSTAEADKWKKKDIRDYSDADLERLFEQWEDADEDELEEDELPEWKRPAPKVDLSKLDPNNPEAMLKATKKGKTLMMFASVSGNPSEKETEQITKLWQTSMFNANMEMQRYVVGPNRVLFMLKDGAYAWEIKDFLVNQDQCESVTIEGQDFPGKGSKNYQENDKKKPRPGEQTPKKKKKTTQKKQKPEKEHENSTADKKKTADKVEL